MSLLKELRALMPHRPLNHEEALFIAERQAIRMRELTGYVDEPFLAREAIAHQPKITLVYDAQLPQSGATHWTGAVWQITINATEPFTRQRYTLAHEFKHILDAPFDEYCYPAVGSQSAGQRAETVCDAFAAAVLMPKVLVRRAYTSGGILQDPTELARLFGVSPRAMQVRLQALGLTEPKFRCTGTATATLSRVRRFYRAAAPTWQLLAVPSHLGGIAG